MRALDSFPDVNLERDKSVAHSAQMQRAHHTHKGATINGVCAYFVAPERKSRKQTVVLAGGTPDRKKVCLTWKRAGPPAQSGRAIDHRVSARSKRNGVRDERV